MIEAVLFGSISQLLNEPEWQMSIITKAMKRQVCCELRGPFNQWLYSRLSATCCLRSFQVHLSQSMGWWLEGSFLSRVSY